MLVMLSSARIAMGRRQGQIGISGLCRHAAGHYDLKTKHCHQLPQSSAVSLRRVSRFHAVLACLLRCNERNKGNCHAPDQSESKSTTRISPIKAEICFFRVRLMDK